VKQSKDGLEIKTVIRETLFRFSYSFSNNIPKSLVLLFLSEKVGKQIIKWIASSFLYIDCISEISWSLA
jgi:hypothetical protein